MLCYSYIHPSFLFSSNHNLLSISSPSHLLLGGRSERFNFEAALTALDKIAGVLHVADFMRTLPPEALSHFEWKLQNLMHETEQKVALLGINTVELWVNCLLQWVVGELYSFLLPFYLCQCLFLPRSSVLMIISIFLSEAKCIIEIFIHWENTNLTVWLEMNLVYSVRWTKQE